MNTIVCKYDKLSGYSIKVEKTAVESKWAFAADDPAADDNVPTKLKNNKFVSLIYPVTDFLGTVPGYNEFDISNWFLLFFTIFFGMIFWPADNRRLIYTYYWRTSWSNAAF